MEVDVLGYYFLGIYGMDENQITGHKLQASVVRHWTPAVGYSVLQRTEQTFDELAKEGYDPIVGAPLVANLLFRTGSGECFEESIGCLKP